MFEKVGFACLKLIGIFLVLFVAVGATAGVQMLIFTPATSLLDRLASMLLAGFLASGALMMLWCAGCLIYRLSLDVRDVVKVCRDELAQARGARSRRNQPTDTSKLPTRHRDWL